MISFATKLHILLIMIVIGFGLYMFLLYKEIKMFSEDIDRLREDVFLCKSELKLSCPAKAAPVAVTASVPLKATATVAAAPAPEIVEFEEDDDDNASVTSNEIKNILTNIRNDDSDNDSDCDDANVAIADTQPRPEQAESASDPCVVSKSSQDLTLLSLEELNHCKYDDLRLYLRKSGHNIKGTKQDLIKKILDMKNKNENA